MIRRAISEDIPALRALQEAIEREGCLLGYGAGPADWWVGRDIDRTHVAVVDGEIAGFVHAVPRSYEGECVFPADGRILEILELLVAASHRDGGCGRELVAAIQAQAREEGFTHLRVMSAARKFDDVLRFYRGCGFTPWNLELTQEIGAVTNPKDIVREGYDRVSHAYRGDTFDPGEDPYYRRCLDLLLSRLADGSRILDLGCGCGIPAARDLSANHDVTGVDISPVQIERARSLVPAATFVRADMTALDLPRSAFDAIVSQYAIIHVPLEEQPALFERIARWLKDDGWLLCTVGHRAWTGTEEDWLGVSGGTMFWSHADQPTYEAWLEDLGFRIVETFFIPEGPGGHAAILARKTLRKSAR